MVRVTVPATSANMGSGYDSIGIALEMYNVIDLAENDHIDISDKNGQFVPKDESNLIYQCAKRVYDECGKPLSGLTIVEDCAIPQTRGLGSSSACTVFTPRSLRLASSSRITVAGVIGYEPQKSGRPAFSAAAQSPHAVATLPWIAR